jgi:predicted transposase YdaD
MLEIVKDDVEQLRQKSKLEGKAEGEQKVMREMNQKTREMARQMLNDGISLDRISNYTGLSVKEIKKLGK